MRFQSHFSVCARGPHDLTHAPVRIRISQTPFPYAERQGSAIDNRLPPTGDRKWGEEQREGGTFFPPVCPLSSFKIL